MTEYHVHEGLQYRFEPNGSATLIGHDGTTERATVLHPSFGRKLLRYIDSLKIIELPETITIILELVFQYFGIQEVIVNGDDVIIGESSF